MLKRHLFPRDIHPKAREAAEEAVADTTAAEAVAVADTTAAEVIISDNTPLTFVAVIKLIKDMIVF